MSSNQISGFTFVFLFISFLIGLSLGDVHTAFDVSMNIEAGGCVQNDKTFEVTAVRDAFTETMEMVGLMQTAIVDIQEGRELPAVGWMFNTLFGIQATEELNDRNLERSQLQMDALSQMKNLFEKLVDHSRDDKPNSRLPNAKTAPKDLRDPGKPRVTPDKTRIFCNNGWIRATGFVIQTIEGVDVVTSYSLPRNSGPPVTHWWDRKLDFYLVPSTELVKPEDTVCGNNNAAFTSTEVNVISFCPRQFERPTVLATMSAPFPAALPIESLDSFNSMSMTFLHEYTHLVGRISLGTEEKPLPDVNLFPEHYQFPVATKLLANSGTSAALRNADSYALLGVALKLSQCDWRDGKCRSTGYWAALRADTAARSGNGPSAS